MGRLCYDSARGLDSFNRDSQDIPESRRKPILAGMSVEESRRAGIRRTTRAPLRVAVKRFAGKPGQLCNGAL